MSNVRLLWRIVSAIDDKLGIRDAMNLSDSQAKLVFCRDYVVFFSARMACVEILSCIKENESGCVLTSKEPAIIIEESEKEEGVLQIKIEQFSSSNQCILEMINLISGIVKTS